VVEEVGWLHEELGAGPGGPDGAVDPPASAEDCREAVARVAILRLGGVAKQLGAVPDPPHPPGTAGVAAAVAAGGLLGEHDCVRGPVLETALEGRPAVVVRLQRRPVITGGEAHLPAEDLEVAGVGGVAVAPVEAVVEAGVAGALVDRDLRPPEPGIVPHVHRVPGGPDDA